jgi:hypothetical protein
MVLGEGADDSVSLTPKRMIVDGALIVDLPVASNFSAKNIRFANNGNVSASEIQKLVSSLRNWNVDILVRHHGRSLKCSERN